MDHSEPDWVVTLYGEDYVVTCSAAGDRRDDLASQRMAVSDLCP